jgi:hypothetical protein
VRRASGGDHPGRLLQVGFIPLTDEQLSESQQNVENLLSSGGGSGQGG